MKRWENMRRGHKPQQYLICDNPQPRFILPRLDSSQYLSAITIYQQFQIQKMEDSPNTRKTNGRWTKQEHLRFLQGLRIHGKNWKKIEQLIETRNGSQIRSHAQKFFLKMQQSSHGEFDEQAYTDELNQEGQEPTLISKTSQEAVRREEMSFFLGKIMDHWEGQQSLDFWGSLIDSKAPTDISNREDKVNSFKPMPERGSSENTPTAGHKAR